MVAMLKGREANLVMVAVLKGREANLVMVAMLKGREANLVMVAMLKGREANRTKNVDIKFSNFGIQYNVGRSTEIVGTLYYINIKRLLRKRSWWWSSYRTCRWFVATCAISAYHHLSCEFESRSWRRVLVTTLCHKVCQ
jgi:hypothetical protein